MAFRQEETLVSRAALRDAIRDDLAVALKEAETIADPGYDGAPVVTIPDLNRALDAVFTVPLPPPDEKHAEVATPSTIVVHAACPECGFAVKTIVYLKARLVVDSAGAEIDVKASSKARSHTHGQAELELPDGQVDGQVTIADVLEGQSEEDAPTEEVPEDKPDGTCFYPGCARAMDHRGLHRDKDGKKIDVDTVVDEGDEAP